MEKSTDLLELLKNEANFTFTENGAVTLSSTQSDCLDLFALGAALRDADESRVQNLFMKAYAENPDQAMKILFYLLIFDEVQQCHQVLSALKVRTIGKFLLLRRGLLCAFQLSSRKRKILLMNFCFRWAKLIP